LQLIIVAVLQDEEEEIKLEINVLKKVNQFLTRMGLSRAHTSATAAGPTKLLLLLVIRC